MGIRDFRIFGIAVADLVAAYVIAYLMRGLLVDKWHIFCNTTQLLAMVIPIGVIVHAIFNVDSELTRQLFQEGITFGKVAVMVSIAVAIMNSC